MKIKLRMIGGSFSHAYSSTDWKKSKTVEYSNDASMSISIDNFYKADFCWIHESKSIIPHIYNQAKVVYKELKNHYMAVFTHDQELLSLDSSLFKFAPACGTWILDPKIHTKTKLVSCISSNKTMCPGHLMRLQLIDKFKGKCDLYGRGFNPVQRKEEALSDYMFSIAIENGKYDTYFTEKILDCFATGTIPIYYGTDRIIEHFNKDGIIFINDSFDISSLSQELYESKRTAIEDNFNRVLNYYTVEDWMCSNEYFN